MDPRRRAFLRGAQRAALPPARPPWALVPDDAFMAACTRCADCVRRCPRGVLRAGDGAFPVIDFTSAGCSLCGDCRDACTSGAISRAAQAVPFDWRVTVDAACLTGHGVECRLCADRCDAGALRFVPALGGITQLRVELDRCTGCGDCVSTCPVRALRLA